jgi:glycosyltransferase involved in cell wall biosynthesis
MTRFRIITPAYNCEKEIEQTILSVLGQSYKNWSMTIIDDLSTDNTRKKCLNLAERFGILEKIEVISRTEKYGEVKNTLVEVQRSHPEDIIVRLDAGDWITDLGCFEIMNRLYTENNPAVLWTAHRWAFTNQNISGPIDPNTSVYDQPWRSSHLKTFRAKELLKINSKNFLDAEGNYIMIACDQAIFLPMMERARRDKKSLIFLPMVMYHYNIDLQKPDLFHNDRSYAQKYSAEWIRERGFIE